LKPAGLQYFYGVLSGWNYQTLAVQNATYSAVKTKYATYNGLTSNNPGT